MCAERDITFYITLGCMYASIISFSLSPLTLSSPLLTVFAVQRLLQAADYGGPSPSPSQGTLMHRGSGRVCNTSVGAWLNAGQREMAKKRSH